MIVIKICKDKLFDNVELTEKFDEIRNQLTDFLMYPHIYYVHEKVVEFIDAYNRLDNHV